MGGAWDATNVADAPVAVITPIAVDHVRLPRRHHRRRSPARRPASSSPARSRSLAQQPLEAAEVLLRRAAEVGATVAREGSSSAYRRARRRVGGQMLRSAGPGRGVRRDVPAAVRRPPGPQRRLRARRGRGVPRRRRSHARHRRWSATAFAQVTSPGAARGRPPRPDGRARRRAQPARRARRPSQALAGGVRLQPARRRGRRDAPTRTSRGCSSAFEPVLGGGRLHPELVAAGDAGGRAGGDRRRHVRRRPGRGRAAARRRDRPGRGRWLSRGLTARRSAVAACSSPARW